MTPGIADNIPADVRKLYECHETHHASAILSAEFPGEYTELLGALRAFRFTKSQVLAPGGNESHIPKTMSALLRPKKWEEQQLNAAQTVGGVEIRSESHKIDYVKGRVAFDLEWNSKDQTFDRDLYAFRFFFDFDRISVGVLVTRGPDLAGLFKKLGVQGKYGASTTHWEKLLPRLQSGRAGGCPILALGIGMNLYRAV